MEGGIKVIDAETDRAGKGGMGDDKFRHPPGSHLTDIDLAIGLERAARTED